MSHQEAAEVEAERQRMFGASVLRSIRLPARHEITRFLGNTADHSVANDLNWPEWMLTPALTEADRAFRAQILLPLAVLGVLMSAGCAVAVVFLDGPNILHRVAQIGVVAASIIVWLTLFIAIRIHKMRSMHFGQCRVAMRRIGWRVCAKCDYVIGRGEGTVCPECGTPFKESVNDA